ncbi:MAG: hypothetical protein M9942_06525 [Microthrixaceae bacterium]|nr:hypothetical protein [Microthrixaceae bacterium]MCO5318078.1 hypothetical protein [Microthrixaceae bacterium]
MALDVTTKDCTALGDAELAEMADVCAEAGVCHEIGLLSKQAEEWVLVTLVREGNHLRGFSFSTLERIGGTPCVLIGLAAVKRTARRSTVLKSIVADNFRRALMAFPDEDVLLGTRLCDPSGFEAYKPTVDIVPRPGYKASGEERAWGRRLVKRFGVDSSAYDDKTFRISGDGNLPHVLDHESVKPEKIDPAVVDLFDGVDPAKGDCLVAFGWIMAEDLLKYD